MVQSKKYLYYIVAISLILVISFLALPEENQEKIELKKGVEVRLEKDGSVVFSLDSPMKVKKLMTKGKWVKVQITGWVMKSKIPELSSKKEMEDEGESEETDEKESKPLTKGSFGPFQITINDIHSLDKVEDRFGTVYKSGPGGSFLLVNLIAQNTNEQQEMNLYKTNIVLIDDDDRQYKSVGISNEESFRGGTFKPEEAREGYLYFSVFDDSNLKVIQMVGRPCSSCSKFNEVFDLGEIKLDSSNKNS